MQLFAIQHVLPSLDLLLDQIKAPEWSRIQVAGKRYSTIASAARQLSRAYPQSIFRDNRAELIFESTQGMGIALDEGGALRDHAPDGQILAGVEQTSSGSWGVWRWPTVMVCRSAAKLLFESQIIARGIIRKLSSDGFLDCRRVGVIGLGALGSEICLALMAKGVTVLGYDPDAARNVGVARAAGVADLIAQSDLILGATGRDCLQGIAFAPSSSTKLFASCSSSDVEFRSLLPAAGSKRGFRSRRAQVPGTDWWVLNAGYPINFDRTHEWERPDEIWLTRMLCAAGIDQARLHADEPARGVMLSPQVQHKLVSQWLDRLGDAEGIRVPTGLSEQFFLRHSEGVHAMGSEIRYKLHETTPGALTQMRSHDAPYDVDVLGVPIRVLPGVWSPRYDWSSLFYVENLSPLDGLRMLEIGTGSGVISAFAARAGAREVIATDVNPAAVENARQNFARLGLDNAKAVQSDLFTNVTGKFDVIAWNAPYHGSTPADMLERGCADENYADIRQFIAEASDYLAPGGTVVFGFSESGDLPLIRQLIAEAGFDVRRELSDWRAGYNCMLFELSTREKNER